MHFQYPHLNCTVRLVIADERTRTYEKYMYSHESDMWIHALHQYSHVHDSSMENCEILSAKFSRNMKQNYHNFHFIKVPFHGAIQMGDAEVEWCPMGKCNFALVDVNFRFKFQSGCPSCLFGTTIFEINFEFNNLNITSRKKLPQQHYEKLHVLCLNGFMPHTKTLIRELGKSGWGNLWACSCAKFTLDDFSYNFESRKKFNYVYSTFAIFLVLMQIKLCSMNCLVITTHQAKATHWEMLFLLL